MKAVIQRDFGDDNLIITHCARCHGFHSALLVSVHWSGPGFPGMGFCIPNNSNSKKKIFTAAAQLIERCPSMAKITQPVSARWSYMTPCLKMWEEGHCWRDGSEVKGVCCSRRSSGFPSSAYTGSSQLPGIKTSS